MKKLKSIAFTKGTSEDFKKDIILECFVNEHYVKIGINNCQPKFGKFVFDHDADFLLNDGMVRYISHINESEYKTNPMFKVGLTKILLLQFIDFIEIYDV